MERPEANSSCPTTALAANTPENNGSAGGCLSQCCLQSRIECAEKPWPVPVTHLLSPTRTNLTLEMPGGWIGREPLATACAFYEPTSPAIDTRDADCPAPSRA